MNKNRCFQYNGQYYDIGTKVILRTKCKGEVVTTYLGYDQYNRYKFDGLSHEDFGSGMNPKYFIKEIIVPVYYQEQNQDVPKKVNVFMRTGSGSWGSHDNVFHGFILYICVMLGAFIFKDKLGIWIAATIIFFSWKANK